MMKEFKKGGWSCHPKRRGLKPRAMLSVMFVATGIIINPYQSLATLNSSNKHTNNLACKIAPITGIVKDANGPLAGVSVYVKGNPKLSTVTDNQGKFNLDAPAGATLIFKFIGYQEQSIAIGNQSTVNITLVEDTSTLNEMVVVGYGTQKKVNLTGAVDRITSKELENRPINNLNSALQGLIPNLNVTPASGSPVDGAELNIRGTTSLNGGEPLILVDNIPFSSSEVARINPADVESVTVLKDAASAAIYGARAAFGVILITTKTAKGKKVTITANANTALRTLGKMADVVTDPYTIMETKHQAGLPLYSLYPEQVRAYAKRRSEDPSLPDVILTSPTSTGWTYYGETDWKKLSFYNLAPTNTVNVSVSQNIDKLSYLLSAEYYQQNGMLKYGKDVLNRYNIRGKTNIKLTDWLNFGNNTLLTLRDYDRPTYMVSDNDFFLQINRQNPLDVPRNPDGTWTSAGANTLGRMQEGGRSLSRITDVLTTFNAEASLIKDMWTLKSDVTFRRTTGRTNSFDVPVLYKTGPNLQLQNAGAITSYATSRNDNGRYDVFNLYTDIHKQLGSHYLQAVVGYNQEYRNDGWFSASRNNLIANELPSVQLATGTMTTLESITDWAVQGIFYRLNYNFKNKYIVELNGRYDGSSRFPENDRWGFFPSASAGWLMSEESFFKPLKSAVDLFKFRASYGSLGNHNVYLPGRILSNYPYIPTMSTSTIGQLLGGVKPVTVNPPGEVSDSFGWEKVSTVNFGVDIAMLKNRLQLNGDIYTRYTKDMLIQGRTLPAVLGTSSPIFNAADLKTKGWELRLTWRDKKDVAGSPFTYNVSFVLSNNKAIITKFDNPTGSLTDNYVGKELGEIWGLQTEGFFKDAADLAGHANQTDVGATNQKRNYQVGDIKFADLNGDGRVNFGDNTLSNHGDLIRLGNSNARLPYALDLSGSWKGFDARVFLQGVAKRDWYPNASNIYFWGIFAQPWTNVTRLNLDSWTPENQDAYFPAVRAYMAERANEGLGIPNERYMQDASYLRVKNITLGYTLPKGLTKGIGLNNVHFYVSGENLFEVSHIKGNIDPEGIAGNIYPFQRTYSFGLNIGL